MILLELKLVFHFWKKIGICSKSANNFNPTRSIYTPIIATVGSDQVGLEKYDVCEKIT